MSKYTHVPGWLVLFALLAPSGQEGSTDEKEA